VRFFERAFVWFARLCASLVVLIPWLLGAVLGAATLVAMAGDSAPERYAALVPLALATIGIGLVATLIGATAGTGLALLAHEVASAGTRRPLVMIIRILSSTPAIAVGVAMVGLIAYWHGAVARVGPFVPVTLAVAILAAPLASRHALRELAKLPPGLRRAAAATGADPVRVAFSAIVPAARRGIAAAFVAAFAAAIGEATAAQIIFANVPDPNGSTGPATLAAVVLAGGADGVEAVALAPACLLLLVLGLIPVILSRGAERSAS
jgi:ABC-type Fe3+ transport system permease subunit